MHFDPSCFQFPECVQLYNAFCTRTIMHLVKSCIWFPNARDVRHLHPSDIRHLHHFSAVISICITTALNLTFAPQQLWAPHSHHAQKHALSTLQHNTMEHHNFIWEKLSVKFKKSIITIVWKIKLPFNTLFNSVNLIFSVIISLQNNLYSMIIFMAKKLKAYKEK